MTPILDRKSNETGLRSASHQVTRTILTQTMNRKSTTVPILQFMNASLAKIKAITSEFHQYEHTMASQKECRTL
jgi:hypothetical protein